MSFRKCYEPHLRNYPDCFEECGCDVCEAPLLSEQIEKAVIAMRKVMKDGWAEFKATIKDAIDANMGEPMYRNVMNTFCNAWAVKALTEAK